MKAGTIIRLPDGREGTVVYHGLDGYGIQWGRKEVNLEEILRGDGNTMRSSPPVSDWFPEAMLRDPYPYADLPCVGESFEVVETE